MSETNIIRGATLVLPFVAKPAPASSDAKKSTPEGERSSDPLAVSEAGAALAALADSADIRLEKVARVRSEQAAGIYDTEGKLEAVLDRILDDIL